MPDATVNRILARLQHKLSLFWLLQLGGWLAFGVAMALSRIGTYPLWYMAVNKTILATLGVVATLGMRSVYRRVWVRKPTVVQIVLRSVVFSYGVSLLWTAFFNIAIIGYEAWLRGDAFGIRGWFQLVDGSLYHTFVLVAWSVLYFAIKYYQDLQAERERVLKAEASAQRARLRALRYQLNPHFLFNTLNAVSTLVVEGQNDAANRMIARLSDFLRLTLDSSDEQDVPLVEELAFTRRYLEIEQLRFGRRLTTRFDVDPDTYAAQVPNMILQPLVENAVKHAVAPREEGGTVTVSAQRVGGHLFLRVSDDGPGLAEGASEALGQGVGLSNTRARLAERYGAAHHFALQRSDGGGLTVVLSLPFRTQAEAAPAMPLFDAPKIARDEPS